MARFSNRIALITGGASGIGAATARLLAEQGATVIVGDIADEQGKDVVADILGRGGIAEYVHLDVARGGDWKQIRDLLEIKYQRLDIVHSNAFIVRHLSADALTEVDWDLQIDVNLKALYLAAHHLVSLLARTNGALIATSSTHAVIGFRSHPAYAAAKGGLCALVRQLAVEYGPQVRVNAVLPGAIMTHNWDDVPAEEISQLERSTPMRRMGRGEDVAAAVAFLASDDASFITGASLVVDGGWSIDARQP